MSQTASASSVIKMSIPSNNKKGSVPALMFGQLTEGKRGLVVLQEWWGLNDQIQDVADHLAKQGGFVTIVPDLYRGKVATDNDMAAHLMVDLDWLDAVQDVSACATYLKHVGCTQVGVTGFGMGGALTLVAAAQDTGVDAVATFYGIPDDHLVDAKNIKIPLQCHFGDQDEMTGFSDLESQEKLKEKLDAGNVDYEFFSYPGACHGFINSYEDTFREDYFKTSFKRLVTFFQGI